MQKTKQIAPALGIYAAYAYRNNGRLDRIQEIKTYSRDDLGGMIFDIAMLSGHFRSETDSKLTTFPFASLDLLSPLPLISQGWSYMETQPLIYPFDIKSVQQHILPSSTWTVYTTEAVEILKEHLYNEH